MLNKIIKFFLENKLVTFLVLIVFISWGIINSPFVWDTGILPSDPVLHLRLPLPYGWLLASHSLSLACGAIP